MAKDKRSVIIYTDWISTFEELEDDEAGRLIKHFFRYVNDMNPDPPDRITRLLFEPIKQTLKRDLKKYEGKRLKNKENAKMRWDKKNATACDRIKSDANHADSDSVIVSDSVIDNDKKKYNNIPPPIKEIEDRIKERGITKFTAEKFHAHYTANGWMVGRNKMKNWDAALTTWNNQRYENSTGTNKRNIKRVNDYWNTPGTVPSV